MTSHNTLSPNTGGQAQEDLSLKHTNVSSPSVIHSKPSQQSITASEDYYSLSSRSTASTVRAGDDQDIAQHTIRRYSTPPSRYRTPAQSRTQLEGSQSQVNLTTYNAQHATDDPALAEVRKTPMRGEGRRRSNASSVNNIEPAAAVAGPSSAALREGGIRRKPAPSTVMEAASGEQSPASHEFIDPAAARSSVARDIDREQSPTPGQDDTPYIRFALDQLTRDEEVRGSRRYPGLSSGATPVIVGAAPYQQPVAANRIAPQQPEAPSDDHGRLGTAAAVGAGALGVGAVAAAIGAAYSRDRPSEPQVPPTQQWPDPSRPYDELPPQHPRYNQNPSTDNAQDFGHYMPYGNEDGFYPKLNFFPGILRPLQLVLFLVLLLVILALLLVCAIWSLTHKGIFNYGSFGDGKYFIFQYLPLMLGMLLLAWLVQIQVALYRIAPFIAMSNVSSQRSWEEGARLPMSPKTWFLPYLGHFRVPGLTVIGVFMVVSWLQIWTIPLLASGFNVYYFGHDWRWVATAALIWIVIAFYLFLLIATVLLLVWLRRQVTGLKWDPRSLADMVVLLERSNALNVSEEDELHYEPPRLGYWRSSRGNVNDVFHSYAIAGRAPRLYAIQDGRLTEKAAPSAGEQGGLQSRFSDLDDHALGREQRHSREKMLPRRPSRASSISSSSAGKDRTAGNAIPWFLKPGTALLWVVIAVVLTLAFLIVSYLPSTCVSKGFPPMVSAPVNGTGFSYTNFLYSFLPALVAMILYLGHLDLDFAYRRLQPYAALLTPEGELAEKSLLLSYTADLPFLVTASAAINGHFRVAGLSFASLLAAVIPILAGGCFWAQFYIPGQTIRIYAHMPAFIAMTVFVTIVAALIAVCVWPSKKLREINAALPRGNRAERWIDICAVFRSSRIIDDVQFRHPASKVDLVTRLLSAPPGAAGFGRSQGDAAVVGSNVSLADSVRGFGRARQLINDAGHDAGTGEVTRYMLGRYEGRDGGVGWGVDAVRM